MRLMIEVDDAIEVVQDVVSLPLSMFGSLCDMLEANAVDAEPVKHGRWCKDGDWLVCLNCESEINVKNSLGVENRKNYCPNCGAKMDGES